jgi:hypothetical protein
VITAEELLAQLEALEALTANVLDYQRQRFHEGDTNLFNPYYDKYAAFEATGESVPHVATAQDPWVLIPPFFHFNSTEDSWYAASLRCARIGVKERRDGEKVFATIFCSPTLLGAPGDMERVIEEYSQSGLDGYFIWVNGLAEEKVSYRRLAALARFIEGLNTRTDKPVYKLYGGFLSVLLGGWGLAGFSCDLSYKTHRDIFRYGWAPPQPKHRFYIPRLHRSYPLDEAEVLLRQFPFLGCACDLCGQAYGKNLNGFTSGMSQAGYCEAHFLNVRRREIQHAARFGLPSCLKDLRETVARLATGDAEMSAHLKVWVHLLSELRSDRSRLPVSQEPSQPSSASVARIPRNG